MHPSFYHLFVHPINHKPLAFFGHVDGDDGIPVFVLSPNQAWPEDVLKELEKCQAQKWIEKRWANGYLWTYDEPEMYPVIDGIPIFVREQTWPPVAVKELREGRWIEGGWRSAGEAIKERSKPTEFTERMAESEGIILDIASGPGGGFVPRILHLNPDAKILMDDLGLGVLQGWQRFLRDKGMPNVSFALFNARRMPLGSNSIDIVSDIGGFGEISGSEVAIGEAYRVLKAGGHLFSCNAVAEKGDLMKLPEDVRKRWYENNPPFWDGFLEVFEHAGFRVISHNLVSEKELSPDEADLPREADKYGVRIHVKGYCTEAIK